jgi:hypothetical protein
VVHAVVVACEEVEVHDAAAVVHTAYTAAVGLAADNLHNAALVVAGWDLVPVALVAVVAGVVPVAEALAYDAAMDEEALVPCGEEVVPVAAGSHTSFSVAVRHYTDRLEVEGPGPGLAGEVLGLGLAGDLHTHH